MASVVIIHAAEDTPPARALAEKLRQLGLNPLVELPGGDAQRNAVRGAAVVMALWSPRSVAQPQIVEEAAFAKSVGAVIHARMQNAANPPDFAGDTSIDLTGWRGEDDFPAWRTLANTIAQRAGVTVPPTPAPRAASPFFQPGAPTRPAPAAAAVATRPAPRPSPVSEPMPLRPNMMPPPGSRPTMTAPPPRSDLDDLETGRSGGARLALIGVITFIVVAALGAGGFFAFSQMQGSQASAAAWEHLDKANPAALRAFLADKPGALRDQAQGVLTALEQQRFGAARRTDTIEAFNSFINDFPHSDHLLEARGRIAELQAAAATPPAPTDPLTGMPAVPPDPDLVPPNSTANAPTPPVAPAPAPAPPAPAPSSGGPVSLTPAPSEPTPTPSN